MDIPNAILVTGSRGLIGRALVECLRQQGKKVVEIDTRFPLQHPAHGNFLDHQALQKIISQCSGVVHLAAVSRVVWGEQDPQLCWLTNVEGTQQLLEVVYRSLNRPWVIYASSREVYGQQQDFPVKESAAKMPLNTYARSKVAAEEWVNEYRERGLQTAILRFSSVYGSQDDHPDRVIPAWCRHALAGQPIRIEGLNNTFDFTHVQDVVSGIAKVVAKLEQQETDLAAIHLTTGKGSRLIQVVELIEQLLNRPVDFYEAPARSYDVHCFYGEPANALKILDWQASLSLATGLEHLLMQYRTKAVSPDREARC